MNLNASRWWPGIVVGSVFGAGFVLLLGADQREAPAPQAERYQLHVWSTDPTPNGGGGHGAYRIDTATGEVHEIVESRAPAQRIAFPAK